MQLIAQLPAVWRADGGEFLETADSYRLLGVSPPASKEAIRKAFHLRLFQLHPDLNPSEPYAADRTRDLIEAYRSLMRSASPQPAPVVPEAVVEHVCPDQAYPDLARAAAKTVWGTLLLVAMALALSMMISLAFGDRSILRLAIFDRPAPAAGQGNMVVVGSAVTGATSYSETSQYEMKMHDWSPQAPAYAPAQAVTQTVAADYCSQDCSRKPVIVGGTASGGF